jgi:DUF1680 family protein
MINRGVLLLCALALPLAAGDLSDRYRLTLDRVVKGGTPPYSPELVLADVEPRAVRRFTNFSGDVSGRYIGALAMAALENGKPISLLDALVPRVLSLQTNDGHFGAAFGKTGIQVDDMAILWGNGRLLIGLLEYYRANPKPEVLASARRIGDFLVQAAPILNADAVRRDFNTGKFAVGYICWTQNLEGVVELYRITKDERYRVLATQLAERTERFPAQHSHGFLSSVRGMVDLYRVTHEKRYLDQASREWQGILDSGNVWAQGAVPEAFYPDAKRTEGCSEADWLRLSLALWRATGSPKYLENAEFTLFNEYGSIQFSTGDFGHRVITATGIVMNGPAESGGTARAWWCCTLHGLRGFIDVFASVFREKNGGLYYDLPVDGKGIAGACTIAANSSLQRDGTIQLESVTK